MARPSLQSTAAATAKAEYQPQIRAVHREARGQLKSLRSLTPALQASLQLSAKQLRHAGLSHSDLAIAEAELAHRTADVGAGTYLQEQQVRQDAHGQLVDLRQGEGQAASSNLATLLHEAAEHKQKVADEIAAERRGVHTHIAQVLQEKHLGLGDYGHGGLTPTQQRAHHQSRHNAAFWAHQYVSLAKGGLKDEKTGEEIIPAGPKGWDDKVWGYFVQKVSGKKGVDSVTDAEHAVEAIRNHFQPEVAGPYRSQSSVPAIREQATPNEHHLIAP